MTQSYLTEDGIPVLITPRNTNFTLVSPAWTKSWADGRRSYLAATNKGVEPFGPTLSLGTAGWTHGGSWFRCPMGYLPIYIVNTTVTTHVVTLLSICWWTKYQHQLVLPIRASPALFAHVWQQCTMVSHLCHLHRPKPSDAIASARPGRTPWWCHRPW